MDVKKIRQFILNRKLYVIIIIIFVTGFVAGFAASQAVQDPTNYLAVIATLATILASVGSMWKLFSDIRRDMNIPSLEYGELTSHTMIIPGFDMSRQISFYLEVREVRGRGQKVYGCEAFMDIPHVGVSHLPLFWVNGNKRSISIGQKEQLQLFVRSSRESETDEQFLLFREGETRGSLSYIKIPQKVDMDTEIFITMQVDTGGSAPAKPFKTTIKHILDTAKSK